MALTRITKGVIKPNENYDTHNIVSTGIVTSVGLDVNGNADISGNFSVGGVLTYEDVTSIDSVGIITARSGVITPYVDVDDFLDVGSNIKLGNAGVITATSFVGSGAALTGIDATAIKDSSGNVKVQAQASGAIHSGISTFNQIKLEDDKYLKLGTGNDFQLYHLASDNNSYIKETGSGSLMIQGDVVNIGSPTSGEYYIRAFENADVQIRYNNSTKIQTTNTGVVVTGILTATSFSGIDTDKISEGNTEVETIDTGSDGHIKFTTEGNEALRLSSNGNLLLGTTTDTQRLHVYNGNGGTGYKTALFDSNDTTSGTRLVITNSGNTSNRGLGIIVGGQAGTDRASFGWFNNDNTYVTPNLMTIQSDGKIGIGRNDPVNFVDIARGSDEENILIVRGADNTTEYGAMGIHSGNCVITGGGAGSTNTGIMFRTAASGNETNRLLITSAGNVEPVTDDTYDFGSLTKRWANIYTADLNLSNEGKENDVDGTWGQYTIQEGQDDLFLINKRSGKKYKFLLQEVS